jgi:diguanylate cyclase (GGDEF)-like protein/PAS domain S-box-containing protein
MIPNGSSWISKPVERRGMAPFSQDEGAGCNSATTVALDAVPFAALLAEPSGNVIAVNQRWVALSGLDEEGSLGPGWLDAVDPEAGDRIRGQIAAVNDRLTPLPTDYQLISRDAGRWTRWWVSSHDPSGQPLVVIAVADVHEERTREAVLYHMATHDALTGLVNRSHFLECTEQALRRSERHLARVGVVFVDLDGFKRVNDLGGHALGNRVLLSVASRLRKAVRSADLVARIGGDEFAVLCEDLADDEQANFVVRRIAATLADEIELDGDSWPVSASVGCAIDMGSSDSGEALLDRADRAMYQVKAVRRGPTAPPLVAVNGQTANPSPRADHPHAVGETTGPGYGALNGFLSDLRELRESLAAIQTSLDRISDHDAPVIDVREDLKNAV